MAVASTDSILSIVRANQTQEEMRLGEDLCPVWSLCFLSIQCVNIFVANDYLNVTNKLLTLERSGGNKQIHH